MPLIIQSQPMIIGWDTQDAVLQYSGQTALTLDLNIVEPQLEMASVAPKLKIDQSQCFYEIGLKDMGRFMRDAVAYSRAQLAKGVQRVVSQGNALADIHLNQDPIPQQARYNAFESNLKEFNYGVVPKSRPKITVERGDVNYRLKRGRVENNTKAVQVQSYYQPWRIQYYVKQYDRVDISYIEGDAGLQV